ncbi:MAG: C2H2-type zinc finger protein [Desulfosarcina sp.]|nr:C2H2-type zinc finger protein [Desulfobacterales bacterium]
MMTHRSKKPFECKFDGCDKSYCDARSLRRHLENHHVHNPEQMGVAAGTLPPGVEGTFSNTQTGTSSSQGQYFQFGASYRQQIMNSNGDSQQFDPQKSPGYLAQVSPVTPTSPMPGARNWALGYNPLE